MMNEQRKEEVVKALIEYIGEIGIENVLLLDEFDEKESIDEKVEIRVKKDFLDKVDSLGYSDEEWQEGLLWILTEAIGDKNDENTNGK